MTERRRFLRTVVTLFSGILAAAGPLLAPVRKLLAAAGRKVLPKDTDLSSLINEDPATLDSSNLALTDVRDFQTMGETAHLVDINTWRLEVTGKVGLPLSLTYPEVLALQSRETDVLMICPGFFANNGRWKGIAMETLLAMADLDPDATTMTAFGPGGERALKKRFPIEDVRNGKVFAAYSVNGANLPTRNGYPLRIVAIDYYGHDWIKYLQRLEFS